MRLVSVVTSTRSLRLARSRISASRSSIWPLTGRISTCGIDEAGGADDLLDDDAGGARELVGAGRGGDVDGLVDAVLELLEFERAVVHGRGQTEAVVDEILLAAAVAEPHAVDLRNGGVALVDEEQEVAREVVEQRGRRLAGQAAGEVARVVLDAVAVAHGLDHFEIEAGALMDALRLDHAALRLQARRPTR